MSMSQKTRDLIDLCSTPVGRRYLKRLIVTSGVYRSSYSGNEYHTFFLEGLRYTGLQLISELNACDQALFYQVTQEELLDDAGNESDPKPGIPDIT